MTPSSEQGQPSVRKNKLVKHGILIVVLVIVLLVAAFGVRATLLGRNALAQGSNAPAPENLVVRPSSTPSATATATPTATATATPTKTNTPTSTLTPTPSATPEIMVSVNVDSSILRNGPDGYYTILRELSAGESVALLGRLEDDSWLYVKTTDGLIGWIKSSLIDLSGVDVAYQPVTTPSPTEIPTPVALDGVEGRWIDIDISAQRLYAFEDDEIVATFLVSTGREGYPTERGQFHIDVKLRYSDMRGNDYFLPNVPWTMYYWGDYAIHGTYWHHNFGQRMSRGCVNMSPTDAEWLFNWASVGTLVNIHW